MSDPFLVLFGHTLFDGLDAWHIGALVAVYLTSYFIKGALGVGNLVLMVLAGALILTPHHAVVLALTLTCFAQLQFMKEGIRAADWSITKSVIVGTYIGLAIGVWIFGRMDGTLLTIALGALLGTLIVFDMTRGLSRLAANLDFRKSIVLYPTMTLFGMISGVGGAGTLSGVSFYIKQIAPDARVLRGTIMVLGIIFAFWRLLLYALTGFLTWPVVIEVALLLPPMLLCGWLGAKFFGTLSGKRYHLYLQVMLLVISSILVIKGVVQLSAGA